MILFGKKKHVDPEIFSEEACQSCGENTKRRFEVGDYVFGSGRQCKKCSSSSTFVTAIYGEYPLEEDRH